MLEMYVDDLLVVYHVKVCKGNEVPDGQLHKGNKWEQKHQNEKNKRGHSRISHTKHPASWMFGKETFYIPEPIAVNQYSALFK